jgi:hypothetical protein
MAAHLDISYADIVRRCLELEAHGCFTYVKWTCVRCRERNTYRTANVFPKRARCRTCRSFTSVEALGGGFLLAVPTETLEQAQVVADRITTGARADGIEAQVVVVNLERTGQSLGDAVAELVCAGARQAVAATGGPARRVR